MHQNSDDNLRERLKALINKWRYHPEFFGLDLISDPNQTSFLDNTLLHQTAFSGTLDEVDVLMAFDAQINASGDIGYTPLHFAAMRGRQRMVKKLLALGADPTLCNKFGETSEDTAINGKHFKVAELIRSYKPKP